MTDVVERYLELGLRLGRHHEDLVDSYYGPTELADRVEAEEPVEGEPEPGGGPDLEEGAAARRCEVGRVVVPRDRTHEAGSGAVWVMGGGRESGCSEGAGGRTAGWVALGMPSSS